jgi:hypothetical protein
MKLYFAVDIEGAGKELDRPTVAYGYCVGDEFGKILYEGEVHIKADKSAAEPRCLEEFYDREENKGLWEELQVGAVDSHKAAEELYRIRTEEAEKEGYQTVIISDCPDYDIARLDKLLYDELKKDPLRYSSKGERAWVVDPSERAYAFGDVLAKVCDDNATARCKHNHRPKEDAKHHYYMFLETLKITESIERGITVTKQQTVPLK